MKYQKIYLTVKLFVVSVFVCFLLFSVSSCVSVVRQSKIVSKDIRVKMTKEEVKSRIGSPYKVAYKLADGGKYYDYWYYKEAIYTGRAWFWVETILVFDGDTLREVKQGREQREGETIQVTNSDLTAKKAN